MNVMANDETRRRFPVSIHPPPPYHVSCSKEGRTAQKTLVPDRVSTTRRNARARGTREGGDRRSRRSAEDACENGARPRFPASDFSGLKDEQKKSVLAKLNQTSAPAAATTLAECRINDTACTVSLPIAKENRRGREGGR